MSLTLGGKAAVWLVAIVILVGTAVGIAAAPTPRRGKHPRRTKVAVRGTPSPSPAVRPPSTTTPPPQTPTAPPTATVDPNQLTAADKRAVAEIALQWAVDGGIPDVKLIKDPENLIVSNANLPDKNDLKLADRTVTVLSPHAIQERADKDGDFLYFRFGPFIGYEDNARVTIALAWAVSSQSDAQYLSGGGATLKFERHEGKWTLLPVTNRWIS